MSKKNIFKIVLSSLVMATLVLSGLLWVQTSKINRLNNQINVLKDINESLESNEVKNYVTLVYIDNIEDTITHYLVNKELEISIYDYLLTREEFTVDDFSSYVEDNYYFNNALTDVLELKNNEAYYETSEWGTFMLVGLQAIILDQNYTVVRTGF